MVSNKEYIRMVNQAVKEGKFNRPIEVVYTKTKPTAGGHQGVASHIPFKTHDRITLWKGLAKNREEAERKERRYEEEHGVHRQVATRDRILRHELWHLHRPYASEREVRYRLEKKPLPRELPTRRRKGY